MGISNDSLKVMAYTGSVYQALEPRNAQAGAGCSPTAVAQMQCHVDGRARLSLVSQRVEQLNNLGARMHTRLVIYMTHVGLHRRGR